MTRRQGTGLAGLLFAITMFVGVVISGSTPDNGKGAVERYTEHWSDSGNQDKALIGAVILTFAWVLLVVFATGLRQLLASVGDAPMRAGVATAGVASAALLGVGGVLVNAPGVAAGQASGYEIDGNDALLLESVGYVVLTTGIMCAALMAIAFGPANRRARVVPMWTLVPAGILALAGLGSIATAWIGFMAFPLWAVVIAACLLLTKEPGPARAGAEAEARAAATTA